MPRPTVRRGLAALASAASLGAVVLVTIPAPASALPSSTGSTGTAPTSATPAGPSASVPSTARSTAPRSTAPRPTIARPTVTQSTVTRSSTSAAGPNLTAAVRYLTGTTGANGNAGGTSLSHDGYYEAFPGFADFGLSIDGAFALAAAGTDDPDLRKVVDVFLRNTADGTGNTADLWTGIGTAFASGGSVGKEAVLAEVTGYDPRSFAGHDLIAALDRLVCPGATGAPDFACAAAGNYQYASSTFSQSLGVIAQLRAGDAAGAVRPVAYLEGQQNAAGAWPSLAPSGGDSDVDSTAIAVMALALLPDDPTAAGAVNRAVGWLAAHQLADGGFSGAAGESANSTGLAIQGLGLGGAKQAAAITRARHFLAGQQNPDGGFTSSTSAPPGSDVRASAQAVSGDVGTSFATLSDDIAHPATAGSTSSAGPTAASSTVRTTPTPTPPPTPRLTPTGLGDRVGRPGGTSVSASAPVAGALASTGLNTSGLLGYAVVLLVAGAGLVLAGRRRRVTPSGRHR